MSFSRYPEYKNSGIDWLGEVPKHWLLTALKHMATLNPRKSDFNGDRKLSCSFVPMEKLKTGKITLDERRAIGDVIDGYTYFENGDVLQAKVTPCFENKNVAIAQSLVNGVGFGSSEIDVLRPSSETDSAYLFYRVQEDGYMAICTASMIGAGGLKRVPSDVKNNFKVAIPPSEEQTQIARFLDHETAKIDTLIHEQKRLIELLKEKRQAVISHAVTKGLDPDVPMKDSGVEWLGEVPAHWQLKRLKQVTSQIIDGAHFTPTYVDTGIPFIRVKDIQSTKINMEEIKRIPEDEHAELIKRCHPAKGDILLSKNGTIGLTKIVDWDFQFSIFVSLCLIKSTSEISSEFLEKVLSSNFASEQFRDLGQKTSVTNLHLEKIREMIVLLPTIAEQSRICSFVDLETAKLALLSTEALEGIALLKERRSALISAAVTGKIDVRDWQPPADESAFDEKVRQAGMEAEA